MSKSHPPVKGDGGTEAGESTTHEAVLTPVFGVATARSRKRGIYHTREDCPTLYHDAILERIPMDDRDNYRPCQRCGDPECDNGSENWDGDSKASEPADDNVGDRRSDAETLLNLEIGDKVRVDPAHETTWKVALFVTHAFEPFEQTTPSGETYLSRLVRVDRGDSDKRPPHDLIIEPDGQVGHYTRSAVGSTTPNVYERVGTIGGIEYVKKAKRTKLLRLHAQFREYMAEADPESEGSIPAGDDSWRRFYAREGKDGTEPKPAGNGGAI